MPAEERHGVASWPGAPDCVACNYSCSHGDSPGTAVYTTYISNVPTVQPYGTLVIGDGVNTITLLDCKVDRIGFSFNTQGQLAHLYIMDRRWRWAFGTISGRYNDPEDRTPPNSAQKPLINLLNECFAVLGESQVQYTGVPDVKPLVNWDNEPAGTALSALADQHGLRVIYRPDNNGILVMPLGVGADLPNGSLSDDAPGLDLAEKPDVLRIIGDYKRYQCFIEMEAVGEDFDGSVKLIDELSYRPVAVDGWGYSRPPLFSNLPTDDQIPGGHLQQHALELARKSVFSWYRPKRDAEGMVRIDGFTAGGTQGSELVDWRRIVLTPFQVDTVTDDAGNVEDAPARVYAIYYPGTPPFENVELRYDGKVPFSVDAERGVIVFSSPMFKLVADSETVEPATCVLRTSVLIRNKDNNQVDRYTKDRQLGTDRGGLTLAVKREDVRWGRVARYVESLNISVPVIQPYQYVDVFDDKQSDYYLDGAANRFETSVVQERGYNGIEAIFPDGAIQQVSWSVGGGSPTTTRASRNSEHNLYVPAYESRRRAQAIDLESMRRQKLDQTESRNNKDAIARLRRQYLQK